MSLYVSIRGWIECDKGQLNGIGAWLYDQLVQIASISSSDADEREVQGLFIITPEVGDTIEWQIRDGRVCVVPVGERHQYLGPQ